MSKIKTVKKLFKLFLTSIFLWIAFQKQYQWIKMSKLLTFIIVKLATVVSLFQ